MIRHTLFSSHFSTRFVTFPPSTCAMFDGLSKIIPWDIATFPQPISIFVPGGVFKLQ